MKRSQKILVTIVAVAGISAAAVATVSAQGGWGGCRGYGPAAYDRSERPMMGYHGYGKKQGGMRGDKGQMMIQRMENLKTQLQITEAQEPAWQAFNQAVTEKVAAMADRFKQRGAQVPVAERVQRMRAGAQRMTEMADAIETFYGVLTPEQQKIADQMRRPMLGRF
jgi:Spy/CpxP family protein refolding chaperone